MRYVVDLITAFRQRMGREGPSSWCEYPDIRFVNLTSRIQGIHTRPPLEIQVYREAVFWEMEELYPASLLKINAMMNRSSHV